ncbi:MAG: flavodoxin family protein [Burkholderiales bacterium]
MKRLLIVFHSQSGGTTRMCEAVVRGAQSIEEIEVHCKRAFDAGVDDLLAADGLIIGTPENFGYMSGAVKDFFDRTFYPCEHSLEGRAYGVFVRAGNDGAGAVASIDRILAGLKMKKVFEPVIARREIEAEHLAKCEELGATIAAGIAYGIF